MSSKGRGAESVESDFYATPRWATEAILRVLPPWPWGSHFPRPIRILEPCAGKGAITAVLREHYGPSAIIHGVELDRKRLERLALGGSCQEVWQGDFAEWDRPGERYDLILTNPPFTVAIPILERCFDHVAPGGLVVHLLRQAILASAERVPFWRRHPARQNILPKRPSFAASLKCGEKMRCKWARIQELEAARPDVCLGCGGKVACNTSDSSDYAWFEFGDGVEREWRILDIGKAAA